MPQAEQELVARAEALAPALRERAAEAERLRRVPDANIAALKQAGLFKVLQARRHGGHQAGLRTHVDVVRRLARGCASTAWCVGVVQAHSWLMAHCPEAAQKETYGSDADTLISAVIAPRGTAVRVEGGYRLTGFWPFGSNSEHAQWLFLGAVIRDAAGAVVDEADLLVPVKDITIRDDWNVAGLRGTGSCSIVAKEVFVPEHRYLSLRKLTAGETPGLGLHEGALYRCAAVPVLVLALTPGALGAAEAAFGAFVQKLPGREVAYTGQLQREMAVTHLQLAEARTKIDVAELLLYRCADTITAAAESGVMMEFTARARVRMDCAHAVRQCRDALELLYLADGGSGLAEANPIQRAWRDVTAMSLHGILTLETNEEMYGRVLLGLDPRTTLI